LICDLVIGEFGTGFVLVLNETDALTPALSRGERGINTFF